MTPICKTCGSDDPTKDLRGGTDIGPVLVDRSLQRSYLCPDKFHSTQPLPTPGRAGRERVYLASAGGWHVTEEGRGAPFVPESSLTAALERAEDWEDTARCESDEVERQRAKRRELEGAIEDEIMFCAAYAQGSRVGGYHGAAHIHDERVKKLQAVLLSPDQGAKSK